MVEKPAGKGMLRAFLSPSLLSPGVGGLGKAKEVPSQPACCRSHPLSGPQDRYAWGNAGPVNPHLLPSLGQDASSRWVGGRPEMWVRLAGLQKRANYIAWLLRNSNASCAWGPSTQSWQASRLYVALLGSIFHRGCLPSSSGGGTSLWRQPCEIWLEELPG